MMVMIRAANARCVVRRLLKVQEQEVVSKVRFVKMIAFAVKDSVSEVT